MWEDGNAYTFRLRPSTYMQTAMLVPEAVRLKKKRWAIVYPNYEYGQSATAAFKKLMKAQQPDVEFVAEQATPLGKIDAGAVAQALADAQARRDLLLPVRPDLRSSCAKASMRGLFKDARCSTSWAASPIPRSAEGRGAGGWCVTGYPWNAIDTPEHKRFLDAYQASSTTIRAWVGGRLHDVTSAAAALRRGATDTDKLVAGAADPRWNAVWRDHLPGDRSPVDHGRVRGEAELAKKDGRGVMVALALRRRRASFQPRDDEVQQAPPQAVKSHVWSREHLAILLQVLLNGLAAAMLAVPPRRPRALAHLRRESHGSSTSRTARSTCSACTSPSGWRPRPAIGRAC